MIVLDTHAWLWWTVDPDMLSESQYEVIVSNEEEGIGVSAISCWEIAKLCEYGRLELPVELSEWLDAALTYPGISLLNLTPEIAVEWLCTISRSCTESSAFCTISAGRQSALHSLSRVTNCDNSTTARGRQLIKTLGYFASPSHSKPYEMRRSPLTGQRNPTASH